MAATIALLGFTVIGGMLAASGIEIFFIPVTSYVVAQVPQPKPQGTPGAVATP